MEDRAAHELFLHCRLIARAVAMEGRHLNDIFSTSMKTILISILLACALSMGACSRSDKPEAVAPSTPNPNLKSDSERLQQATAKAAEERKRAAEQAASPTATP
jgi:Na+-transporting methylmalonyl-CoA/oxaloacetate decarboxylase gamma subunit